MSLPYFVGRVAGAAVGAALVVEGDEARHAVVRRVRVGEQVAVTDGAGTTAVGSVSEITKSALTVTVSAVESAPAPAPHVTVVQAIPKGDRAELAVEVLTEIGVDRIVPWQASRCVAVWRGERAGKSLARWRATARESGKQARRAWHPEVTEPASTAAVAALLEGADVAVVLHETGEESISVLDVPEDGYVVIVVGPEGGINEEELTAFHGAHVVRMGEPVLRTSTAGVAAVAALLSRTRRWG